MGPAEARAEAEVGSGWVGGWKVEGGGNTWCMGLKLDVGVGPVGHGTTE